jgi:hypothetical protein
MSVWLWRSSPSKGPPMRDEIGRVANILETRGETSPAFAAGRDIHVNYVTPTGAPSVPSGDSGDPQAAEASPNLEYAGSREKRVFVSPLAQDGICDPRTSEEHENSLQALILKFENKVLSDRKIARAMNVIAKVRFESPDRIRQRAIDYGVWLNSPCNSTDIGIGDTCELVLMCVMDGNLVTFGDRRSDNRFHSGFSYIDDGDVDDMEMVEVALIDQHAQATLNCKLRVWRQGASFCIAER